MIDEAPSAVSESDDSVPKKPPASEHAFLKSPDATLLKLAFPVLLSMVAEPLTGLVDTAFVSRLGASSLAGLGIGIVTLSSTFWVFNFLGIGSQTEIAKHAGAGNRNRAGEVASLALMLAVVFGVLLALALMPLASTLAALMGANDNVQDAAVSYMNIRLLAAPAVLIMTTGFGILRGMQEMKVPMFVAIGVNIINLALVPVLIYGYGPVPAMGVAGSALATTISQWIGAVFIVLSVRKHLHLTKQVKKADIKKLMTIAGDLFVRTGLLSLYLVLTTREANKAGADAGAVHQAIRQFWIFTALFLDSFAVTGQSLVGFFLGSGDIRMARKVAATVCKWSILTGVLLALTMVAGQNFFSSVLVPKESLFAFSTPWLVAAAAQPLNALAFATDGIHWGTGDFAFLRKSMMLATGVGAIALLSTMSLVDFPNDTDALTAIWLVTSVWITIRATLGILRLYPGIGKAPLKVADR